MEQWRRLPFYEALPGCGYQTAPVQKESLVMMNIVVRYVQSHAAPLPL